MQDISTKRELVSIGILTLFSCFETLLAATTRRQLVIIANAVLTMTGQITMLSLSQWESKGSSYCTIQWFFATRLPWTELLVKFFYTHLFFPTRDYILVGDATTVTKAGKQTHGIDRFFWAWSAKLCGFWRENRIRWGLSRRSRNIVNNISASKNYTVYFSKHNSFHIKLATINDRNQNTTIFQRFCDFNCFSFVFSTASCNLFLLS